MTTGTQSDLKSAVLQYCDKFSVLTDNYERVQLAKRSRFSTSSTCSIREMAKSPFISPSNVLDLDMDILKQLPTDEKLNMLLECLLRLNLIQSRVDNSKSYVYFSNAAT